MFELSWVKNLLSIELSRRCGSSAFLFFSGLTVIAIMMPKLVGFSGNTEHASNPFHENRFKIVTPLVSNVGESIKTESTAGGSGPKPAQKTDTLFHPIINRAAAQYKIDPDLVRAIIFAESGYNPRAVSKRGAKGLMQLMPGTAKAMGVEDCFNPEHNIFGGVKYFKKLFLQFDGDVKLALAAYNAGSRKVREFNGVPPFKATEHYIQKVMKRYEKYKNQQTEQVNLS